MPRSTCGRRLGYDSGHRISSAGFRIARANTVDKQDRELRYFVNHPTVAGIEGLKEHLRGRIQEVGVANLTALERSQEDSLFLDAIKVLYPQLLPQEFPGRLVYHSCLVELSPLQDDVTDPEAFARYEHCMNYQFGGYLPANHFDMLNALQELSGPELGGRAGRGPMDRAHARHGQGVPAYPLVADLQRRLAGG